MLNLNNFQKSRKILVNEINKNQADALIINSAQNRSWLLNFQSSDGFVIVQKEGQITFLIDGRYHSKAHEQLSAHIDVRLFRSFKDLEDFFNEHKIKTILIEDSYTNVALFKRLEAITFEIKLFSAMGVRINKYESEINALIRAADIAVETTTFLQQTVVPGMSELAVAQMATIKMLELGGEKNSFDPIVASGINGANPHHHPTQRILEENELVTLDLGCVYHGFCSDMTRTWAVANTKLPEALEKMHEAVLTAQDLGLAASVAHNSTNEVDAACRKHLKAKGYGEYFVHSTGHGVGLDVHELPNVTSNPQLNTRLTNGMVITVEPGVYVPGIGGLRIEDTLVIRDQDPLVLNAKADKRAYFDR
ncbi:Xaa-Pro aminopeptidase [Mycoplasmoides fastidiosum]|uniref:Xaa-Pro aminopeptidase n=1 Tax=Mycoplasmoides fastidiosum TaxID=92758 RepID=A0ABU0M057_9BACT|nr:aminopeptidase P family protein [Mycoplasmoides fastidiosum]MDQ0514334.1 Xaa-Pro aminopeptidase [Mycoplasmoides fastidiosum]UUD38063.1 aminopeptidase P family protein [Mycoplasmoides fastidiosum]